MERMRKYDDKSNESLNNQIKRLKDEIQDLQQRNTDAQRISSKDNSRHQFPLDYYYSFPEPVFLINNEGEILNCNFRAANIFSISQVKMDHHIRLNDYVNSSEKKVFTNIIQRLFENELESKGYELTMNPDQETELLFLTYFNPLYKKGIIDAAVIIMVHISGYRKSPQDLLREFEFSSLIYDSAPTAVFTVDNNKTITSWNKMAERITGYSAFEAIGKKCGIFSDNTCMNSCKIPKIKTAHHQNEHECIITTKTREKKNIHKKCDFLKDKNGGIIGRIESFEDITGVKSVMHDLIVSKERAQESDQLKSSFLANMSHEIRTPVNGIIGFAELLKDATLSLEEREEYLGIIKQSGNQLLTLVNDIIDISKIEANQLTVNMENFSLNLMLEELQKIFNQQIEKSGKKISLEFHKGLDYEKDEIKSDPFRLRQILTNLLTNAVKFTHQGAISFGYRITEDCKHIEFFVKDSGVGIPEIQQDFIFKRFAQVNSVEKHHMKGTGLGLAITKGILEILNGSITVESKQGTGTIFRFNLPFVQAEQYKLKKTKKQHVMNYNWGKKTILIVEDDHVNYKYLEITLHRTRVKVIRAHDGQQAVELCQKHPEIDVVLMDIQLPVLDGYKATRKIKSFRTDLPIIAQTANAMDDDEEKCLKAGCDDYLTKPISHEVLFDLLGNVFREKHQISS